MFRHLRILSLATAMGAMFSLAASSADVGTIIKLNLADVGPDVELNPVGNFHTRDDGNAATTGDQNTNIEFTGILDFLPDVTAKAASFSMHDLQEVGPAATFGNVVVQNFVGGTIELYDPANTLLLSGQ